MAIFIDEHKMVDDNTFLYEEKIKSPTSRFIDTTPVYVNYFHINMNESTTDDGFIDVNSLIGERSPLRFNKIEKFPLYGVDQVILQLSETDAGFDTSFEGDGIILPGTIKPVMNDYFVIPTLKDSYVFRITNINYDNVMPDNFYKIEYKLEYIDDIQLQNLENQKVEEFVCILENIGTESNCIIEKSSFTKIKEIEKMYHEIIEFYKAMFYDERHNVFLCPIENGIKNLYDPFQADFINSHSLFKEKNNLETLILTDQYTDSKRKLKYAKSIYKYFELKDHKLLTRFQYSLRPGITIHESSFYRWHDKSISVIDIPVHFPEDSFYLLSEDMFNHLKYNNDINETEYISLIFKFINNKDLRVKDISLNLDQELIYLNDSFEVFMFTPIIMYIIREIINKEISIQKEV